VSVLALCDEARVTEHGMRWELDGERLGLLDDRGLSNYVVRDDALIRCDKGTIAAFVMRG
jgi:thiamine pyrophosphokinase